MVAAVSGAPACACMDGVMTKQAYKLAFMEWLGQHNIEALVYKRLALLRKYMGRERHEFYRPVIGLS